MRVMPRTPFWVRDADLGEQRHGACQRVIRAKAKMLTQRLRDLAADTQHGVERCHGILEDHGDLAPA